MPFACISGRVYDGSPSWSTPEERRAALGRWISVIAREVGKRYDTHSERSAAEVFARSHRLSIAHAFHRKLVRKDVVAELARLYQLEIETKADVSP